jgi:hypothetical protein
MVNQILNKLVNYFSYAGPSNMDQEEIRKVRLHILVAFCVGCMTTIIFFLRLYIQPYGFSNTLYLIPLASLFAIITLFGIKYFNKYNLAFHLSIFSGCSIIFIRSIVT